MELSINNKLENKNETNNEVNSFLNELKESLEKNNKFSTSIANEICKENPLAIKYKEQLEEIINKCFEEMSYEKDFCYFDYDPKEKIYYLDHYTKGDVYRTEYTENELGVGSFWRPYENSNRIVEAPYMGDGIKSNVESELFSIDLENKK